MPSLLKSAVLAILIASSSIQSAQAVNIAIIDTGLDPGILGGVLEKGGFDFYNKDNDPRDESSDFHGTAVGHVAINSGSGITLTAIKAFQESCCTTNAIMEAAFNYVATLDSVRVVSYSGAQLTNTPLSALLANTDAGKVVVMAAGNLGGSRPAGDAAKVASLDGKGMVAGGLTPDGMDIQDFSNRAGDLKDHYIMAHTNSLITSANGTSMSTPRVSAAAATLFKNFGFLSAEQVVQILFNTATDLGAPGADSTYGHGALNLAAALSAAGAGNIPTADSGGGGGGGGGGGAGIAALALGGAAAYALMNKDEELQRTVLVDAYGRAFRFNFADRLTVRDSRPSVFSLMANRRTGIDIVALESTASSYTQALVSEREINPFSYTASDRVSEKIVSFLRRTETPESYYALALNTNLSSDFGALSLRNRDREADPVRFYMSDMFTTPVLGYSGMGSTFMYGWNDSTIDHRFGVSVIDDQQDHGLVSNSILYESSVNRDRFRVGFQLGALIEKGSFLGGSSDSVLGVDQTSTYYLGVNGSYNISKRVTLLGGVFQGSSSVNESRNSLLSNFSGLRTEGYAAGVLVDDLFSPKGSFGLSYSSPLQTTNGSATLTLPVSQDWSTGEIGFDSSDISFSNAEREQVIEAYYDYALNHNTSVFTHMSYTRNPLDNLDASHDRTIYVGWKHRF